MKIDICLKRIAKLGYPTKVLHDRIVIEGRHTSLIIGMFRDADAIASFTIKTKKGSENFNSLILALDKFYTREIYKRVNRKEQSEMFGKLMEEYKESYNTLRESLK